MTRPEAPRALSVVELEAEIARTRARLSHNLAVLDREYALRHLLVRGTRIVRATALKPGGVAAIVQREILPLAVIAAGVAWLAFGRQDGGSLLRRLSDGLAQIQSLARELLALSPNSGVVPPPLLADSPERSGAAAPAVPPGA